MGTIKKNWKWQKIPNWMRLAILKKIKEGRIKDTEYRWETNGFYLLQHAMQETETSSLFDHWRTEKNQSGEHVLVSEPYLEINTDLKSKASRFASLLNCRVELSTDSEWCPGWTIKITFLPPV